MEDREVHSFKKNARETVRVFLTEFKGYKLLDLRVYIQDDTGKEIPTRKGLTISQELVGELVTGLRKAIELIESDA